MADLTLKQHDTYPPLKGKAADENGPLALAEADSLKIILKSGATLVTGEAKVIDPPDEDGNNWKYEWDEGDTDTAGEYEAELEITWDKESTPKRIETVPNDGTILVNIVKDLA